MFQKEQLTVEGKQNMPEQELMKIFSRNLRIALELKKANFEITRCKCCGQLHPNPYTQAWLAEEIGISKATVVHFFQGNRIPSLHRTILISKALGISVEALCGIEKEGAKE